MAHAKAKPVKKTAKKPAPKKAAAVKKTSNVKAKKPAAKKPAPKKVAVKKPAQKKAVPVKKASSSKAKAPAKKAAPKKTIVKKTLPKKNLTKKASPTKAQPAKKAAKPAVSKNAASKPAIKTASKKPVAKPAPKKAEPKKIETKKVSVKKAAESKLDIKEIISKKLGSKTKKASKPELAEVDEAADRPSAGVHFTMDDLMSYLDSKGRGEDKSSASASSKDLLKKQTKSALKAQAAPKKPLAAASIADILGFNPMAETRAHFEEKDVPQKWKKYYKLLMEIKKRFAAVAEDMTDVVAPAKEELTHEQAVQGMDAADIGSKNFERDMAYSLLSNEQAILEEVDAAIERMRDGSYGVCEVTGKAIPETRLLAVPWTRCTIEGQRMREAEQKKQKNGMSRNMYGEIGEDMDDLEVYDENDE